MKDPSEDAIEEVILVINQIYAMEQLRSHLMAHSHLSTLIPTSALRKLTMDVNEMGQRFGMNGHRTHYQQ